MVITDKRISIIDGIKSANRANEVDTASFIKETGRRKIWTDLRDCSKQYAFHYVM